MSKQLNSYRDTRGALWVACSECERGGNGTDEDKCASGWNRKKYNGLGCFSGKILSKYKEKVMAK